MTRQEIILSNAKILLPKVRGKSKKERRFFYMAIGGGPIGLLVAAFLSAVEQVKVDPNVDIREDDIGGHRN